VLHNLVHLAFGIVGLLAARAGWRAARAFLIWGGVIYLALFVYGLVVDKQGDGNFVPVDNADDWLHLVLGAAMVVLGALAGPRRRADYAGTDHSIDYPTGPTSRL